MSSKKGPQLPDTPTLFQDPIVGQVNQGLYSTGSSLIRGDYSFNPGLEDTVNFNPEMTRLAIEQIQAQLAPSLRTSRQDVLNQLEANNQLTGSTTASALGNIQSDYESRLVAAGAEAGMADINRALQNRVGLFGTGLNTLQAAGQGALANQTQVNQFNLENYQNQVAKVTAEQKQKSGGLLGGLTGALGGAAAGSIFGPVGTVVGGLAGGAAGAFGPSGTGGSILSSGAGLYGANMGGARLASPGTSTATTNSSIFGGESITSPLRGSQGLSGGFWPNLY